MLLAPSVLSLPPFPSLVTFLHSPSRSAQHSSAVFNFLDERAMFRVFRTRASGLLAVAWFAPALGDTQPGPQLMDQLCRDERFYVLGHQISPFSTFIMAWFLNFFIRGAPFRISTPIVKMGERDSPIDCPATTISLAWAFKFDHVQPIKPKFYHSYNLLYWGPATLWDKTVGCSIMQL